MRDRWSFVIMGFLAGASFAMLTNPGAPPFAWFVRILCGLIIAGMALRLTINEDNAQNN